MATMEANAYISSSSLSNLGLLVAELIFRNMFGVLITAVISNLACLNKIPYQPFVLNGIRLFCKNFNTGMLTYYCAAGSI